jgi:phosphatidylglycerol:prolipoprotein diacylglycerol transferase
MLPTILQIGPVVISSLGFFTAIGLFFGSFIFWERGRKEYFKEEELMDVAILTGLASIIGGRIGWGIIHWNEFSSNLLYWFDFVGRPGFWQFSAFISGFGLLIYLAKKYGWDFFKVADVGCFGLVLFLLFNRIGLFLDGSYYGTPTNLPIGLKFPGMLERRHPVQLYEFIVYFLLFRLMFFLEKNYRTYSWYQGTKGEAKEGFILSVVLFGIGLVNLLYGFIRNSVFAWSGLEIDQWFGLLFIIAGGMILYLRSGLKIDLDTGIIQKVAKQYGKNKDEQQDRGKGKREKNKEEPKQRKRPPKHRFKAGVDVKK